MTLREVWEDMRLSPTEVAGQARISMTTLYKMNRREKVSLGTIKAVCKVLNITIDMYEHLEADH